MNKTMGTPFVDLVSPHLRLEEEFVSVFRKALKEGRFIGGPEVEGFEMDFAHYCGVRYCVGSSSGTDALRFALMASGVKKGDLVVTVANTFIATSEAITQAGAVPVFVDVDEHTFNMDPARLSEFLETECEMDGSGTTVEMETGRPVTAVVPVHLYGQMADMDTIGEIASKYNLRVIEDACQAHGARYFSRKKDKWVSAGSMGVAAAFSFYPGKNLGACGEGGAITTSSPEIAEKARMLRDHGQSVKYFHEMEGYNGRLDAIQAGILRVKLKHLDEWNERRRKNAEAYNELLGGTGGVSTPFEPSWSKAVYHLYVIKNGNRDMLREKLNERGFSTGLHYPLPLHLQRAYAKLGYREGELPVTEKTAREILSLPMFPELTVDRQEMISEVIKESVS